MKKISIYILLIIEMIVSSILFCNTFVYASNIETMGTFTLKGAILKHITCTNSTILSNVTANTLAIDNLEGNALEITGNTSLFGNLNVTGSVSLINNSLNISNTTLISTATISKRISLPDSSGIIIVTEDGNINIPDNSITSAKIVDGSITGNDLQAGAINYTQIANGGITPDRLAGSGNTSLTSGTNGQVLFSNGDGTFSWLSINSSPFISNQATDIVYSYSIGAYPYGNFSNPKGVAIDNNGKIYVADTGNNRIQIFSSSGAYEYSIGTGSSGSNIGQFYSPSGVTVDSNGKIYVAESSNHRIQIFSNSGAYEFQISSSGGDIGLFRYPIDLALDSNGKIYVADYNNHRIQIFSNSGAYEYSIGTGSSGSNIGQFNRPSGVAVDSNGKIYVADYYNHRIQIFYAPCNETHIIETGNLGIGTTNPSEKLEVVGSIKIVDGNQEAGKVLVSDTNGVASWGNAVYFVRESDTFTSSSISSNALYSYSLSCSNGTVISGGADLDSGDSENYFIVAESYASGDSEWSMKWINNSGSTYIVSGTIWIICAQ